MKRIIIEAVFTGQDGSLGYRNGIYYVITIQASKGGVIWIEREDGSGICSYDSIISFLNNWDNVSKIS